MKSIYVLLFLLFLCSCEREKKVTENNSTEKKELDFKKNLTFDIHKISNPVFSNWINYYEKMDSSFSLTNFEILPREEFKRIQGNVLGNFEKDFDQIYEPFLMYSPSKKFYIDMDSYSWIPISTKGKKAISFSPDQEINLVDLENKTVERLAFRGPAGWVEDVFWMSDSTVVLLENDFEEKPFITIIHLDKNQKEYFNYKKDINIESNFLKKRFEEKGFSIE